MLVKDWGNDTVFLNPEPNPIGKPYDTGADGL